ncbi:MAG TPA: CBS domain-containing protein, partial [Steroidobacteraceae bacterium]
MQIADVCNRNVVFVLARDSVADAARVMRERHVGSLVVVEGAEVRRPVGMLTDRDIAVGVVALGLDPETTLVSSVMRPGLVSAHAFEPLERAVALMRD